MPNQARCGFADSRTQRNFLLRPVSYEVNRFCSCAAVMGRNPFGAQTGTSGYKVSDAGNAGVDRVAKFRPDDLAGQ